MQLTITGPEIKAARLKAGLTRTQLAAAMLCSSGAICHWENGKNGITRKHHATLCRILDLELNQDKAEEAPPAQEAIGAPVAAPPPTKARVVLAKLTIYMHRELEAKLHCLARAEYRTPEAQVSWIVQQHLAGLGGEG